MANIDSGSEDSGKAKQKKHNIRVDFTPMVDMNMLLLTFFMFCTTLSKPQIMDIVMPADDSTVELEDRSKTKDSKTVTLILGENDKVFYYEGKTDYENFAALKETTFSPEEGGLREYLLKRNKEAVEKMIDLKRKRRDNSKMTEEEFNKDRTEIRTDKENIVVIIKPTEKAKYSNLVDALDEMAICSVGTYAIVDMTEGDDFMMKNLESKGIHAKNHEVPK